MNLLSAATQVTKESAPGRFAPRSLCLGGSRKLLHSTAVTLSRAAAAGLVFLELRHGRPWNVIDRSAAGNDHCLNAGHSSEPDPAPDGVIRPVDEFGELADSNHFRPLHTIQTIYRVELFSQICKVLRMISLASPIGRAVHSTLILFL